MACGERISGQWPLSARIDLRLRKGLGPIPPTCLGHGVLDRSMSVEFSSSGSAVISRQLEPSFCPGREGGRRRRSERELKDYYEIERCVQFLHSQPGNVKVALRWPDPPVDPTLLLSTFCQSSLPAEGSLRTIKLCHCVMWKDVSISLPLCR